MKKLTNKDAEKLAQITDHFTMANPFLLVVKRGEESFYLLNDQWGETTRWSYPSNNSLAMQLDNLTTISIAAGKHGHSKKPVVLLASREKEDLEIQIIGSSSDNNPVVLRLYYPTIENKYSIVTVIERPYEKPDFSYKVSINDKGFLVSEFLASIALVTPCYTEFEAFFNIPAIKYGHAEILQGGHNE